MQSISSSLAPRNRGCSQPRLASSSSFVMVGKNCIASKNGPSCSTMRWIVALPISILVGKMGLRLRVNPECCETRSYYRRTVDFLLKGRLTCKTGSGSEIGNDHLPMLADLGRGSGRQYFSQVEHRHVIANVEYQVGMMLDQQHAGTRTANRLDQYAEAADFFREEAGRRFVEQQKRRAQHQRAGDLREAQLAVLQPVGAHRGEPLQPDRRQGQHGGVAQRGFVATMARQRQQ